MSISRKFKKLRKNPKAFFWDARLNPLKKIQAKLISQSIIIATNSTIESHKMNKLISDTFQMGNNKEKNLAPLAMGLSFDYILQGLSHYSVNAVYIKPTDVKLKPVICILHSETTNFFTRFLSFLHNEGLDIAYKLQGKIKKPESVADLMNDMSSVRHLDMRVSINTSRLMPNQQDRIWFRFEFVENHENYYMFPTANLISRKLWKHTSGNIFKQGLVDYWSILTHSFEDKIDFDIDLVFTWVNSEDVNWQEMYRQYKPDFNSDATSTSRFLSRDELKYALRSWEKYGNFIRKVFIVSNCAPPSWLDLNNERVEWVQHEQIMPESVLPTFSSHAIETSLFRIPGLSNHFIYSNDDFLLVKPITAYNFYYSNGIAKLRLENWGNVNGSATEGEPDYLNAARNSNALLEKEFKKSTTQLHTHSPQSMRIDILQEMYNKYSDEFNTTMSNKFRAINDIAVTGYFYHHYALLSGRALQSNDKTELIQQNHDFVKKLRHIVELNNKKDYDSLPLSVCINDGADSHLNESWNKEVMTFLDNLFPEPSSFEK